MSLTFEWDPQKAASNFVKHGITFSLAASAFADPYSLTILDPKHSQAENRFILLGKTSVGIIVVVVHVERGARLRIISARRANIKERRTYAETQ